MLSIRGTADIFDALTDVLCEAVPFLNGEAHSGMLKAAYDSALGIVDIGGS